MIGHDSRILEGAPILKLGGYPGCPEAMFADPGAYAGRQRAPLTHEIGIGLGKGVWLSRPVPRPIVRNNGPLGSSTPPVSPRYACKLAWSV